MKLIDDACVGYDTCTVTVTMTVWGTGSIPPRKSPVVRLEYLSEWPEAGYIPTDNHAGHLHRDLVPMMKSGCRRAHGKSANCVRVRLP